MNPEPRVLIDLWSDYVCPFCYLELPVLEALAQEFGDALEVRWHAFELRPEPVPTLEPDGQYLHDIWGRAVYPMAAQRGMRLALPPVQPRSRAAHEAALHARALGRFEPMNRALFAAFFEQGLDIGRPQVLAQVAESAGLAAQPLLDALAAGTHTEAVRADQRLAQQLGVTGVPLMALRRAGDGWDDAAGLSGAQPLERVRPIVQHLLRDPAAAG